MARHPNPSPPAYDYITLSFRVLGKHAKLVHEKAASLGAQSAASYMRDLVMADVGVPVEEYSAVSASQIAEIARLQGVSVEVFERRAIREAAERAAKAAGLNRGHAFGGPKAASSGSGERPATRLANARAR